jgi:hypothetical protein
MLSLVIQFMAAYAVVRLFGLWGFAVLIILTLTGGGKVAAADQPQCFYRGEEEFRD